MSTRVDRMIQRARSPLSALRPVVPSVFSPEPSLRDDIQESSPGSAESPHTQGVSGSVGESTTLTFSKPAPGDISDSRVSEALPTAQESPQFKLSSFPDREGLVLRDEPKTLGGKLSAQSSEQPQSRISKASRLSDIPATSGAASSSPSATTLKNEADATRRAQESATASARTKQADAVPPSAPNTAESLIEVNVSIGNIDFRSGRPAEPVKRSEAHPHVTLDSYLQRGKRDAR